MLALTSILVMSKFDSRYGNYLSLLHHVQTAFGPTQWVPADPSQRIKQPEREHNYSPPSSATHVLMVWWRRKLAPPPPD
jgi:hypothetical protein